MPVRRDELSLNLTYEVYKGQEHLFSFFVLAGVVTDCTYELSVKQHFISFKNTGVPREGISKKCTENHQEDMHHANLFLASGSPLSLASNQPGLSMSKIQMQCNSAA